MDTGFKSRAYLICCDARTGSALLASTLRGTGRAGKPFEYFSRSEIDKPWFRSELHVPEGEPFAGFAPWRGYILSAGAEMGGVFAASVHWFQLDDCLATFRAPGADPQTPALDVWRAALPDLRLIWLQRRNVVAQAISHYVAIATNQWTRRSGVAPLAEGGGAPYDFARIDWQVHSALVAREGWRATLAGAEAITLSLTYEDLAADLDGATRRAMAHVGVDPEGADIRPGLEKQGGAGSLEMERRYREERRTRGLGPVGDEAEIG